MILTIDNYDSFVHNLARHLQRLGHATRVIRNDAIDACGVRSLRPAAVVLSPGPCTPREAGCSLQLVRELWQEVPLLGVCLGHQTIAAAFGGRIVRATHPMHGRTSLVYHNEEGLFEGIPNPVTVCRYHSLAVEPRSLPPALEVTAWTRDGTIMALRHREARVVGVQFHPEAILTQYGYPMLANFLRMAGLPVPASLPSHDEERSEPALRETPMPARPVTF